MKQLTILIIIITLLYGCDQQTTTSNNKLTTKKLKDFNKVVVQGNIKIAINNNDHNSIITANNTDVNYHITKQTLYVNCQRPIYDPNFQITINSKSINNLVITGNNKVELINMMEDELNINNYGENKLDITGNVPQLTIYNNGNLTIKASNLTNQHANIVSNGALHATIATSKHIEIAANGNHKILYLGNPKITNNGIGNSIVKKISS